MTEAQLMNEIQRIINGKINPWQQIGENVIHYRDNIVIIYALSLPEDKSFVASEWVILCRLSQDNTLEIFDDSNSCDKLSLDYENYQNFTDEERIHFINEMYPDGASNITLSDEEINEKINNLFLLGEHFDDEFEIVSNLNYGNNFVDDTDDIIFDNFDVGIFPLEEPQNLIEDDEEQPQKRRKVYYRI